MLGRLKIWSFYNYSYQFSAKTVTAKIVTARQLTNNWGFCLLVLNITIFYL